MAKNFKPSGDIRLKTDMAPFFGDDGNASLTEFYRGGTLVPNNVFNNGIPTSGEISMTDFRGATNESYALTVDATPVNEGGDVVITLTTTNVPNGTEIHSRTVGTGNFVPEDDIVGGVGTTHADFIFEVNNNTASVEFTVKNDFVSDGGLDSNGIPQAGNETITTTLYTNNSYNTPIGGPTGDVSWQIIDTSLSWYATFTSPTISGGIYTVTGSNTITEDVGYSSSQTSTASMSRFQMNCNHNAPPTGWSIALDMDDTYGRVATVSPSSAYNTIMNFGNNTTVTNGHTGTFDISDDNTSPFVDVNRPIYFPTGLSEGTYEVTISERGRLIFTEDGGQNRVLGATGGGMNFQTPLCHFDTTHIFQVLGGA